MKIYFPELNYFYYKYKTEINDIVAEDVFLCQPNFGHYLTINEKSLFALLFSNAFSQSEYHYLFSVISSNNLDIASRERIRSSRHTITCYVTSDDDNAENLLSISDETITMLDLLLNYRLNLSVDLSSIIYANLENILSKLIYIYLDLMLNNHYNNIINILQPLVNSSNDIIIKLYCTYIINESYKKIKNTTFLVDSEVQILRPVRQKYTVDSSIYENNFIRIEDEIPFSLDNIFLYKNGDLQTSNAYDVIVDSTSATVSWTINSMNVNVDDVIIVDYYVVNE